MEEGTWETQYKTTATTATCATGPAADHTALIVASGGLRDLMARLLGCRPSTPSHQDVASRELCCTPFNGNYGLAGWVVCLNGSPPRGTLLVMKDAFDISPPLVFYAVDARVRRIARQEHLAVIRELHRGWLDGRGGAFVLHEVVGDEEDRRLDRDFDEAMDSPNYD